MNKDKQLLLDEIKDQIEKSGSFITLQYTKVPANTANNFRREIAKVGGSFEVVKKRLFIKVYRLFLPTILHLVGHLQK